jgi:hypothetical protein
MLQYIERFQHWGAIGELPIMNTRPSELLQGD